MTVATSAGRAPRARRARTNERPHATTPASITAALAQAQPDPPSPFPCNAAATRSTNPIKQITTKKRWNPGAAQIEDAEHLTVEPRAERREAPKRSEAPSVPPEVLGEDAAGDEAELDLGGALHDGELLGVAVVQLVMWSFM